MIKVIWHQQKIILDSNNLWILLIHMQTVFHKIVILIEEVGRIYKAIAVILSVKICVIQYKLYQVQYFILDYLIKGSKICMKINRLLCLKMVLWYHLNAIKLLKQMLDLFLMLLLLCLIIKRKLTMMIK